jgi:hypothetical protein
VSKRRRRVNQQKAHGWGLLRSRAREGGEIETNLDGRGTGPHRIVSLEGEGERAEGKDGEDERERTNGASTAGLDLSSSPMIPPLTSTKQDEELWEEQLTGSLGIG